jgi:hypothetical protein
MRFSCVFEIFMVIASACWLLHVYVAYLWFKQYIKDACGSKEHQLPNICIMRLKHGNTIAYWKYRNNRQLDLMDRHWNTNK